MALSITFVNETGTNLNRYKIVNTNTNETTIVDLERAGNITTPGTRLTAELMNSIVAEINNLNSKITSLTTEIGVLNTKINSKSTVSLKVNSDGTADLTIS